jgi:predicted aspartyl protease
VGRKPEEMSTFSVQIEAGDPQAQRFESIQALVDTGSTYTVLPASLLRRLGVEPHRTSLFELADGSQMQWQMGRTWLRIGDQVEMSLVVFGEDNVEPLLGAVTLEEFLLAPDPIRHRLVPVSALMMRFPSR